MNVILKSLSFAGILKNRRSISTIFVVCSCIFLIFYWTYSFISSRSDDIRRQAELSAEKIYDVKSFLNIINGASKQRSLDSSLLSYVQNMNTFMQDKITNIKLAGAFNSTEQVSFRAENLTYADIVKIIKDLEQYGNVSVKSLMINKRFDNPKRADSVWDVVRTQ